jgi:GNAT superfamily N-acetyltransferase
MRVTIEPSASPDVLSAPDLTAATAIYNAAWAAWVPGERPVSEVAYADGERVFHAPEVQHRFLARADDGARRGQAVALGSVAWRDPEPEPGACITRVMVLPAARGEGVASAMGRHLVEVCRDAKRIGMTIEAPVDSDGDEMCRRAGLRDDLTIDLNRADTRVATDEMLHEWVATGEAAAGYSLVAYDDRVPDDLLDAFTAARHIMNDAPRYEGEPESIFTAEELRAAEAAQAAARQHWWGMGVRHDATGDIVGLSDLFLVDARPWIGFQGDTGVAAAHRGHGLGAWMKATNHLRLRRERPLVEELQTWNASSNAPMLRINHALGYKAVRTIRAWFLPLD